MKALVFLSVACFFSGCTFGSEGNSLLEKQIIYSRILSLYTTSDSFISSNLYFYDDRADSVISEFTVGSGTPSADYTVKLNSDSKINSVGFDFYLDPPSGPFSQMRHTDTTNAGSSADVSYASPFSFRSSETVSISSPSNINLSTGPAFKYIVSAFAKAKRGILRRVQLEPASIVFSGTVKGTAKTIPFTVILPSPSIALNLNCRISVSPGGTVMTDLRLKTSGVFKDNGSPLLSALYSAGTDGVQFYVGPTVNSSYYSIILKNLTETDVFKEELCSSVN
ncbi:MAG TPA: hypothetical protein PKK05_08960 [Leptospiraceae bacterium]|nr:hypothetical protein [Leptospiraceae bacterium]